MGNRPGPPGQAGVYGVMLIDGTKLEIDADEFLYDQFHMNLYKNEKRIMMVPIRNLGGVWRLDSVTRER